MPPTTPEFSPTSGNAAPAQVIIISSNPDYALAQATIDESQRQLLDLSRKATEVSLNMSQAANAAALSTQEHNQRQQMDLDFQATAVSLNMARAAATQEFIAQQTKAARDATATAQSKAAAAARLAYLVKVTQTAHAQMILNGQFAQTQQSAAALTAYPMTATPFAVTQAALLMQQYNREQQSFVDQVVTPLIPIAAVLGLLLFILVIVLAVRRYTLVPLPRLLGPARENVNPDPVIIIDGVLRDPHPQIHRTIPSTPTPAIPRQLPGENTVRVEMMNAAEPPVAHWIAEVEQALAAEGGL